ncbi:MAG: flagellar basal body rod protein FlgC, partial [Myxococcota bacterium]
QRTRLDVVSANLANAQTTRAADGNGPYRRQDVILEAHSVFDDTMASVRVAEITEDPEPPRLVYNPSHPDADQEGYVAYPNVNTMEEMVDMITAMRSYQANLSVVASVQEMARSSLTIGRNA